MAHITCNTQRNQALPRVRYGERGTIGTFGLTLMIVAVLLASTVLSFTERHSIDWVDHTRDVIGTTQQFSGALADADTARRAFLLTGDTAYLDQYRQATRLLGRHLGELRSMTADNPGQQARLTRLASVTAERVAESEKAISARHYGGHNAGLPAASDSVSSLLSGINKEEHALLDRRLQSRRVQLGWLSFLSSAGVLGGALVLIATRAKRRTDLYMRESETQFRGVVDGIPQLCWTANAAGVIDWYNQRWYEYTGSTPEEMDGCGWESFHDPETLPSVREQWSAAIKAGAPFEMVFPLRGADGTFRPFLTRVAPFRDRDGDVIRWFGTNTEIGAQRRVEEALRRGQESLRLAQQVAQVGTFDWDIRTGVNRWTSELEAMYGLQPGEFALTLDGWSSLVHPDDREGAMQNLTRSLETGHFQAEWRVVWPDKSVHWLYGRGSVLKDHEGKPYQMIGVNIDITERKLAEESLRESEARYSTLAEALPAIIFTSSASGETDYVNSRWREYTGLDLDQSQTGSFIKPVHPADRPLMQERWLAAKQSETVFECDFRLRRADGVYRWFHCRATPLRNAQGKLIRWLGISSDTDDEKKSAEALRQAQKMEAVGRLAGGVAHDFNNLLTAIIGYNSMLQERVQDDPELAGYAQEVSGAADRAAALTRQLLTFSSRQVSQPKIINVNTAVRNFQNLLKRVIGEDIQIELKLAPDLGLVRLDPGQLDQVIMNLAVNARDAMPNGGRLTFQTINISSDDNRDLIQLRVRDTGIGMDAETHRRLFEPFFTTKKQGKGTGLGLSIVYGVVQQNGGDVRVESEPGMGSTFILSFPRCLDCADAEDTLPAHDIAGAVQGKTVLVVEDDEVILNFASSQLRRHGYRVLAAGTPAQAIRMASATPDTVDLLLSDVLMPEMRGPELVKRLREMRPELAVLYMSGYSDSTFLDFGTLQGSGFLQKPFTREELLRKIDLTLANPGAVQSSPLI